VPRRRRDSRSSRRNLFLERRGANAIVIFLGWFVHLFVWLFYLAVCWRRVVQTQTATCQNPKARQHAPVCACSPFCQPLSNAELVIAASAQPKAGPQTGFRALSAQKNLVQEMRMTNK